MAAERRAFVLLNLLGGTAVLGSYVLWLTNPSNDAGALWGAIAGPGRTAYTVSMLAAAAGYFAFAPFVLRLEPARAPLTAFNTCFTLILFPSALWMPLAFEYLDAPSPGSWWAMRAVLGVVGVASLAVLVLVVRSAPASRGRLAAAVGAAAFTVQTLLLDAIVWPLYFPR